MNPCPEYAALLDLYVDGELTADEMSRVAQHLAGCPGCAAYVDDILAIRAAFPDAEDTPVPEDFTRRVMEAVAAHPRTAPKKRRPWLRAALPLAACLAVVILLQSGTLQRLIPAGAGSASESAAMDAGDTVSESSTDGAADTGESGGTDGSTEERASLPRLANGADEGAPAAASEPPEKVLEDAAEGSPSAGSAGDAAPEAAAEAAPEESAPEENAAGPQFFAAPAAAPDLTLTAKAAGTLLDAYTPAVETETQRLYQLTAAEYAALLAALDDADVAWSGPAADTAETFLVAVTP